MPINAAQALPLRCLKVSRHRQHGLPHLACWEVCVGKSVPLTDIAAAHPRMTCLAAAQRAQAGRKRTSRAQMRLSRAWGGHGSMSARPTGGGRRRAGGAPVPAAHGHAAQALRVAPDQPRQRPRTAAASCAPLAVGAALRRAGARLRPDALCGGAVMCRGSQAVAAV